MKFLNSDVATATTGWQAKSGTFDLLQNANDDDRAAIWELLFPHISPTSSNIYIISGCIVSGSSPNQTAGGGYVMSPQLPIDGGGRPFEILNVVANNTDFAGTPTFYILQGNVSAANADPTMQNNGTTVNVHYNRYGIIAGSVCTPPSGVTIMNSVAVSDLLFLNTFSGEWKSYGGTVTPIPITAVGGSIASNVSQIDFVIQGKTLLFELFVSGTLSGSVTQLHLDLSAILTAANPNFLGSQGYAADNNYTPVIWFLSQSATTMYITNQAGSFANGAYNLQFNGVIHID